MELISLPSELLQDILLLLKPYQLFSICRSNLQIQNICQDEYFWQQKVQRDYPKMILNRRIDEGAREYYRRLYQMSTELKLIYKFFEQLETLYREQLQKVNKSPNNFTNLSAGFYFLEFVCKQPSFPTYVEYSIIAVPGGNSLSYEVNARKYSRPEFTPLLTDTIFSDWIVVFNYLYDQIINSKSQIIALAVSEVLHPQNIKRETVYGGGGMIVLDNLPLETNLPLNLQIYSENINISEDFFFEQP